jgi:crossover junction endodeoxyribonuclease RuvC
MRVLGVDPGTRQLGWGVIERVGTRLVHVAHGTVSPEGEILADRLLDIDRELGLIIERWAPACSAVEAMFFAKNAQTAAKLGHARGVVLLALRRAGLAVAEYPPALVKRSVVGTGRAEKHQVAHMVARVLGLALPPASDAADALAVALTHLSAEPFATALARAVRR